VTGPLLAEFKDPRKLRQAIGLLKQTSHHAIDAFTPYPFEDIAEELSVGPSYIRPIMLAGGLIVAACAFGLQWYSAVIDYPINSGGRPLDSWQVFLLVPFEVGIFAAAVSGVVALLWSCGLPRLHHPLFEIPGFERATQDRFFLLADTDKNDEARLDLRRVLESAGAVVVTEVRQP
jgi:hypothetical protein